MKAKFVIQHHNPSINASRGWIRNFFNRHKLALRTRVSISQKLSKQVEGVPSKFHEDVARFMRIGKYPLSLVGNMDETPAFFDMVLSKCTSKKGERDCVVRSSGSEKNKTSATAGGQMFPTIIIFKVKTEQTICNLNIPPVFIVRTQKKGWMYEDLVKVWIEEVSFKHTEAECKRIRFENSLLSFDAFAAHLTHGLKAQLLESNSHILQKPAGCTSKCQPIDVSLNKSFDTVLRRCW